MLAMPTPTAIPAAYSTADSEEVDDGSSNELLIMILKELVDKVSNESSVEEVEGGGNRKSSHTTHPSVGDYRQSTDDDDDNVRVTSVNSSSDSTTDTVATITGHSGPSQKDTTLTKLFVGGLPYHTTDKSLRDHFKVYGEIEEAVVITDRQTGKSRGYGFVIMADRPSAERACKEPNPIIDGRKANVNLAILGAKPRGNVAAAAAIAATNAFPFAATTIHRAIGYPSAATSAALLAASQYGIPASYIYPPNAATSAAYGGTPLLSHISGLQQNPATNPAIAAALAAQQAQQQAAAAQHQLYDGYHHHPQTQTAVTAAQAANAAAGHFTTTNAAQFAAAQAFAALAADPYNYLAAAANGPYATYIPAGNTGQGGNAPNSIQLNPYAAAVAQESSRI